MSSPQPKRSYPLNAFYHDIFSPFDANYYVPYINVIHNVVYKERIRPKLYQLTDSFMMFYKPFYECRKHLVEPPITIWHRVIHQFVDSEEYLRLNELTAGSTDLAIVAAVSWWRNFAEASNLRTKEELEALSCRDANEVKEYAINNVSNPRKQRFLLNYVERGVFGDDKLVAAAKAAAQLALERVKEYVGAKEEAEAVAQLICGSGGQGYSHESLSIWHFLEKPDEFRRKVRLLRECLNWLNRFSKSIPTSLEKTMIAATYGGAAGVGILNDYRQIPDLHPCELSYPTPLRIMRILTKRAVVVERAASVEPVVFVDKSGSMAESWGFDGTPKISAAAGLALAFHRKLHADIYLFDTEVDKVSPREVVDTLLRIEADGGTCIEEVLKEVERLPPSRPVIVITDGIDDVDEDFARRVASRHKVLFILIPPCWERDWLKPFKSVKVRSPSEMFSAATTFLSSL